MSAIAGILQPGGIVDVASLQRMLRAMAHRSPDGCDIWSGGEIVLGHGLLRTLPEPMPAGPIVEDALSITADARLDNRDELLTALGIGDESAPDPLLILAAYRKWGEGCAAHLLGDFAFAIWDAQSRALFCARDHFGIKPFYYHAAERLFVFASEIKALFAQGSVPRTIDDERIADYLLALVADAQSTFYSGIRRLPPAHCMSVTAEGCRLSAYWQLAPAAIELADAAPAEQFRKLFTDAIRCRLRSSAPVGAMLSGGLDSSSIASVAAAITTKEKGQCLPTVSLVFDKTPNLSERPAVETVLALGGFDPTFVACDDYAPFGKFDEILDEQEGAFLAPGLAISRRIYSEAARRGIQVILDGHGGDEVVSHGFGRLRELAAAGRWFALWNEVKGVSRIHGGRPRRLFADFLQDRFRIARYLFRMRRAALRLINGSTDRKPVEGSAAWHRFVNTDLVARTKLPDRFEAERRALATASGSERAEHLRALSANLQPLAFEILDRAAARAGVEPRYPFWDKRLVEFCLALPSEEKLAGGWSRLILRRAMEGILPPAVQWRKDKLDFTPHLIRGMLAHHGALLEEILVEDSHGVGRYANLANVGAAYRRILDKGETADGYDVHAVWRTVVLALWLRKNDVGGGEISTA